MDVIKIITFAAGFILLFFAIAVALIYMGYWMGRNSAEKPLRSANNPAARRDVYTAPVSDPPGDLFNDAAFGSPTEDGPAVSTLRGR